MTSTQPNPIQTTDAGIPVQSDKYSLTVGAGGPILLQDSYLIEQMAQFNRERITERQPHAKGSGAFGQFEVTSDVSEYSPLSTGMPASVVCLGCEVVMVHSSSHDRTRHRPGLMEPAAG